MTDNSISDSISIVDADIRNNDSPALDLISCLNVYIGSSIAIILNIAVTLAVHKSKTLTKPYTIMLDANVILCIVYATVNILTNPAFASLYDLQVFLIVKGGIETNYRLGQYLLLLYVWLIIVTSAQPCVQFLYRYLHIVYYDKRHIWSRYQFIFYSIIFLGFVASGSYMSYYLMPSKIEIELFNETVYDINIRGYAPFLLGNLGFSFTLDRPREWFEEHNFISILVTLILMLISSITGIYFAFSISRSLRRGTYSERTRQLQQQLQRTLIAQAFIPFLTIQIPFHICFLAPSIGINVFFFTDYVPLLITYYPVLSPLTVLYYCKDVHRFSAGLIAKFLRSEKNSTIAVMGRNLSNK